MVICDVEATGEADKETEYLPEWKKKKMKENWSPWTGMY